MERPGFFASPVGLDFVAMVSVYEDPAPAALQAEVEISLTRHEPDGLEPFQGAEVSN